MISIKNKPATKTNRQIRAEREAAERAATLKVRQEMRDRWVELVDKEIEGVLTLAEKREFDALEKDLGYA